MFDVEIYKCDICFRLFGYFRDSKKHVNPCKHKEGEWGKKTIEEGITYEEFQDRYLTIIVHENQYFLDQGECRKFLQKFRLSSDRYRESYHGISY